MTPWWTDLARTSATFCRCTQRRVSISPIPAEFYPLAKAQTEELAALRSRKDAHWVFVSPAADFAEDGARTGKYKLGGEELTLSSAGESVISYADYAVDMADLIEKNDLSQIRVSLVQA